MKISKNELQDIILGNEQTGPDSQLKTAQSFLRRYAEASSPAEKQQRFKDKETAALLNFGGQRTANQLKNHTGGIRGFTPALSPPAITNSRYWDVYCHTILTIPHNKTIEKNIALIYI
jgi:hypothetical protein